MKNLKLAVISLFVLGFAATMNAVNENKTLRKIDKDTAIEELRKFAVDIKPFECHHPIIDNACRIYVYIPVLVTFGLSKQEVCKYKRFDFALNISNAKTQEERDAIIRKFADEYLECRNLRI